MQPAAQVDAKKSTFSEEAALRLLDGIDEFYSIRGKKVVHLDLKKTAPDITQLKSLLLGPTGNLRAPTLRKDRTLVVGFDEETYRKVLG